MCAYCAIETAHSNWFRFEKVDFRLREKLVRFRRNWPIFGIHDCHSLPVGPLNANSLFAIICRSSFKLASRIECNSQISSKVVTYDLNGPKILRRNGAPFAQNCISSHQKTGGSKVNFNKIVYIDRRLSSNPIMARTLWRKRHFPRCHQRARAPIDNYSY